MTRDDFYPFGRDYKQEGADWTPEGEANADPVTLEDLQQMHLTVWVSGGYDDAPKPQDAPENGFVEIAFFAFDSHVSSVPLGSLLRGFDGQGAGVKTELIALRKLKDDVQAAISKLERKAAE
jgi:hypothetical protein